MSERWDICAPEKSKDGGKTYWTKIGVMFRRDKGGFVIHMAYPAGELYAFEPKERDQPHDQERRSASGSVQPRSGGSDDPERRPEDEPADEGEYDDIPF
jgi:hypothetical protein